MSKYLFKLILISGFYLILNSCFSASKSEEDENINHNVPSLTGNGGSTGNYHYKAPDGAFYWSGDVYRNGSGVLYKTAKAIGQNSVLYRRAIISKNGHKIFYLDEGFLAPVNFDRNIDNHGLELKRNEGNVTNTTVNGGDTVNPRN